MKRIQLCGRNKTKIRGYVLVDDADYKWLNQWKWSVIKSGNNFYASRGYRINKNKQGRMLMHRLILNVPKRFEIDHINRNSLDNRRENLRICTRSENCRNTIGRKELKGVYLYKKEYKSAKKDKWFAMIGINYQYIKSPYFNTKKEAIIAYNKLAKKYHKNYAYLHKI